MERKHKLYLKLNLMSIFFIAVSFISVTLAWFAYSGLSTVETEIGVKAWYIEFEKNEEAVSNDIVISLSEIYPGMETINEIVSINNLGDSLAQINYEITSARILDTEYTIEGDNTSLEIEDKLSHDYPFHININLEKNYVKNGGDSSLFNVSISWPLDSDTDEDDSYWGTEAYKFQLNEDKKHDEDNTYQPRTSIKIVIKVNAEQYFENLDAADTKYNLGDLILYDVANNRSCDKVSDTCIKTHVISDHSKLGDTTVNLLPDVYDTYVSGTYDDYQTLLDGITSAWNVEARALIVDDLLHVISNDIMHSFLIREGLSNSIIGNLNYTGRMNTEIAKAIEYNGYYSFKESVFDYLLSSKCYWTSSNYNDNNAFAFAKSTNEKGRIYPEDKTISCSVIPVIIAPKSNIN